MEKQFGYVRVATAVPRVSIGDVPRNVERICALFQEGSSRQSDLVLFPELCLTGYTCADLFHHESLLAAAEEGLEAVVRASESCSSAAVVGLPLRVGVHLFNCAVAVHGGRILGAVPKTTVPNYREFYEKRWFASARDAAADSAAICGTRVPFGSDLLFQAKDYPLFTFGIELCEDLWAPIPPSTGHAMRGETILLNASASDELVGKDNYRRQLVTQQSARCVAAYVYCSAGVDESTTDVVFGGHTMIAENGRVLRESPRFARDASLAVADIDIGLLQHERLQYTTFADGAAAWAASGDRASITASRVVMFEPASTALAEPGDLERSVDALPFVPKSEERRHEICREIVAIQSTGLATRLEHTGIDRLVLGLSGGLDSTLALLIAVEACDKLDLDRDRIHAVTMPGFGTSERTLNNVTALCRGLGVTIETIDITASSREHLRQIGHDTETPDITYENAQARERTQILMDKANMLGGLVVGTGDLSELALGWCTYNADHMSMYGVNAGVPKTLVMYLITYIADTREDGELAATLRDILETPISPELLPGNDAGGVAQKTEEVIGPYELHDFFLYHLVRRGSSPEKTRFLALKAFGEQYDDATVRKWLKTFITRFFQNQFKRSCMPDGPKVGTLALSPRGDWRMPSDASWEDWLRRIAGDAVD